MVDQTDDVRNFFSDLAMEVENTIKFLVESVLVYWSPNPDGFHHPGGFRVTLSGAVALDEDTSTIIRLHPRGTVSLHELRDSGYGLNEHGEAILGALILAGGDEIEAHLLLPPDELRALATLLPTAAKERSPVKVWMHAFAGLKEWDGKNAVRLARTSIVIG